MKDYSKNWIKSRKPRKQRKYRIKSPLHIKQKLVCSKLSKELSKKYKKRSIGPKKGDKVNLVYRNGALKITVQAKSMGEGLPGDYIYVKNLQTGKRLRAQIVKPGEVQIK